MKPCTATLVALAVLVAGALLIGLIGLAVAAITHEPTQVTTSESPASSKHMVTERNRIGNHTSSSSQKTRFTTTARPNSTAYSFLASTPLTTSDGMTTTRFPSTTSIVREPAEQEFLYHYDLVANDAVVDKTIDELLAWAAEEVRMNVGAIQSNLRVTRAKHDFRFNLLWPGAGYASIACGGQFEVFSLLEKQGVVEKIGAIMGNSGGATSALLAAADTNRTSRTLLFYYHVMEAWKRLTGAVEVFEQGAYLPYLYEHAMRDEQSFLQVKRSYWAMAKCWEGFVPNVNHGFNNCNTRRQCAQLTLASGELSVKGMFQGVMVDDLRQDVGSCRDGGSLAYVPSGQESGYAHVFYNSQFGISNAMGLTLESIRHLFKSGVTDTIQLLKSDNLRIRNSNLLDSMDSTRAEVTLPQERSSLNTCTRWYDVGTGQLVVTPGGCNWWR